MIKNNKRRPGSINTTPLNKIQPNQARYYDQMTPSDYHILQESNKSNLYQNNHANKNHKERIQIKTNDDRGKQVFHEQLIEIEYKNQQLEDLQNRLDKNLRLQTIISLNLSFNCLKNIPNTIFNQLKNVRKLYLQNNLISKISFPYFKENNIQIVNLSYNKIGSLNLEHLQSLIKLQCSNNELTFLTLPHQLQILDCSTNKLSNIYFMQNCSKLQEVNMSRNMLYDLKFNFKPYIKFREDSQEKAMNIKYKYMRLLDCSFNKIVYLDGMIHVVNLRKLVMNDNEVSFTRHIVNQITQLLNLEELYICNNPLEGAGFSQAQILQMISSKLTKLQTLNAEIVEQARFSAQKSQKKSQFSQFNDQPYNLFMDSFKKQVKYIKIAKPLQWNFTLGDCQGQNKLNDLSQIDLIHTEMTDNIFDKIDYEIIQKINQCDLQETYHKGFSKTIHKDKQEQKLKLLKSNQKGNIHERVFFQPLFTQLIDLSYIPPHPIVNKQELILGKRLQEDDQECIILQNMFRNKGGLIYARKVMKYNIIQNGRFIFDKYNSQLGDSSLGFLLNDMKEEEFRQICKFNKLIKRTDRDIIGFQPNVFTCFHVIVRQNNHYQDQYYYAAYMIETNHL